MSSLSSRLGRSAGVGSTVQTAPPPASDRSSSAMGEFRTGLSDVTRGRVSLLMLNSMVLLLVVFYIWTRKAQGGG